MWLLASGAPEQAQQQPAVKNAKSQKLPKSKQGSLLKKIIGVMVLLLLGGWIVLQHLGSGLINHSQKMTTAAMQIADMKV
jgi:hypothetical protein